MHEWQNLSHVRWDCKYHVVIIPKYRRKVFYGRLRRQIGGILRELCRQRGPKLLMALNSGTLRCALLNVGLWKLPLHKLCGTPQPHQPLR